MTIHLLKIAAGIKSLQELQDVQKHFRTVMDSVGVPVVVHTTRNTPTRADEILDGGSMYWIIKGAIQARQAIKDITRITDADGQTMCQILLSPELIRVSPLAHRPIQGWRYLDAARAPRDICGIGDNDDNILPDDMAKELQALGLL